MGMCLEPRGKVSIEVRSQSFRIAYNDADPSDPNPEFDLNVLDDLISALEDAKKYVQDR